MVTHRRRTFLKTGGYGMMNRKKWIQKKQVHLMHCRLVPEI